MDGSSNIKFLLRRISKNDEQAFTEFFDLYYKTVFRFATYFINDEELIQEIVSDVFFGIWQSRKKLPGVKNIKAYLYTSTRNKAFYYLKKNHQQATVEIEDIPVTLSMDKQTPENITLNKELQQRIQKSVDTLPEKCRLIFLMAREEGLKYREIARILSISEKTVNAQIVIAIKKLGKVIQDYLS